MSDQSGDSFLIYVFLCVLLVAIPMLLFCWQARRKRFRKLARGGTKKLDERGNSLIRKERISFRTHFYVLLKRKNGFIRI